MHGRGISLNKSSDLLTLTPFAVNPSFSAALIIPNALVPFLSVPAASLIFEIGYFKPYYLQTVARQAQPQSL
ncbi:hypothetical protein B2H96_18820 [Clostridium botulinum]|nr:hypothetical protein B2H90_18825 [Clostridium botulinum]OSB08225.1 hypothetical protein B2H96_18820 [Clostridium botulinum]